jgi:N-acetylmuramoyl-L-alanine amidase CwlA
VTRFRPPSPPYVGPAAHTSDGSNKPVRRIVLHSTVSPCEPGQARKVAGWFRNPASRGSAHYVVDPTETVQVVFDSVIAWHAPPNGQSLGIEMCEFPTTNKRRWDDRNHQLVLERTAKLTAQLCLAYDVPVWFRWAWMLRLGMRGITTHAAVSKAWRQSSHWDPGAWPRRKFMKLVRANVRAIKAKGRT